MNFLIIFCRNLEESENLGGVQMAARGSSLNSTVDPHRLYPRNCPPGSFIAPYDSTLEAWSI